MRYIVLILLSIGGAVLSGAVGADPGIMGLQIDIALLIILSAALLEKTSMPILFAAVTGLLMDILFSTLLGVYAISYTVAAVVMLYAFRNRARINVLMILAAGAGGYLIKELVMALIVYALGVRFSLLPMMARYILPAAALNAALLLVAYLLLSRVFQSRWMKPRQKHAADDFSQIG